MRNEFWVGLVSALLLSASCASLVNQKLDPNVYYRRDIGLEINGVRFKGVAVPKPAEKYEMVIRAKGVINMLTVSSCSRDNPIEKGDPGWFEDGSKAEYTYVPLKGIEDEKSCIIDVGAYEEKKGRHSWGLIALVSGFEKVPAVLQCDGKETREKPVSICQSRAGLTQRIKFDRKMKIASAEIRAKNPQCDVMRTSDEMTYEFSLPLGECIYFFGDENGNFHQLVSSGYEGLLVRGRESDEEEE